MLLNGNKVVITGGGRGIGRALGERFTELGSEVIVAGQKRFAQRDAVATPGMSHLVLDQDDPSSIEAFAAALRQEHPTANVLINNAGIQRVEDLKLGEVDAAEQTITINLLGPMRVTAALMPQLLAQPSATIINISSALAFIPLAAVPTYGATKAALHSYTMSLRYQLRDTSVQVIEVVPPMVQTGLQGDQGFNSAAMPLDEFVAEVMEILQADPDVEEVVPDRAKPLRFAERDGQFQAIFDSYNQSSTRK